jgi:hypothetical protein
MRSKRQPPERKYRDGAPLESLHPYYLLLAHILKSVSLNPNSKYSRSHSKNYTPWFFTVDDHWSHHFRVKFFSEFLAQYQNTQGYKTEREKGASLQSIQNAPV